MKIGGEDGIQVPEGDKRSCSLCDAIDVAVDMFDHSDRRVNRFSLCRDACSKWFTAKSDTYRAYVMANVLWNKLGQPDDHSLCGKLDNLWYSMSEDEQRAFPEVGE